MDFKFQVGDLIVIKSEKKSIWSNPLFAPFLKGFRHTMFYYGENYRGLPLGMESSAKGAAICTLEKENGREVEVYRLQHQYAGIFIEAILKAGEKLVNSEFTFYDYFLALFKILLSRSGLFLRSEFLKRCLFEMYPFRVCSDFSQFCFKKAVNHLEEPFCSAYKEEVLACLPLRLMLPPDFREISVLEKVWEGKIEL